MGVIWKSGFPINTHGNPFEMGTITLWQAAHFSRSKFDIETSIGTFEVHGSGFATDSLGRVSAGNVTKIVEFSDGQQIGFIAGVDLSVKEAIHVLSNPTKFIAQYMSSNLLGNDLLSGSAGNDFLEGFAGKDRIAGHRGNDTMRGDAGADTFIFAKGDGDDTIEDFKARGHNHDVVDLSGLKGIHSFQDVLALLHASGNDTLCDDGLGDVLVLQNVDIQDLGKSDFIL
jgi:Ca2+-binding RTX toxin-like protein